jgi:hypothetical protein
VKKARAWAFRQFPIVISELASGREKADVIGLGHGHSVLIECKASRADFKADQQKDFRRVPRYGMGNFRYYLAPAGIIRQDELPAGWGLLELRGERVYKTVESHGFDKDYQAEISVLVSTIRRIGPDVRGMSIKRYSIPTKNTATILVAQEPRP